MPKKKKDKLSFKKNDKRKKAMKKLSLQHTIKNNNNNDSMITKSKARDISHLYTILTGSNLLSSAWSLSTAMEGSDVTALFCHKLRCDMSQLTSAVLMTVFIQNNFEWSLSCMAHIMDKSFPPLHGQPELLQTPQDVVDLLTVLDKHEVCTGNNDECFIHLVDTRKGVIKDQSGKYVCHA